METHRRETTTVAHRATTETLPIENRSQAETTIPAMIVEIARMLQAATTAIAIPIHNVATAMEGIRHRVATARLLRPVATPEV